MTITDKQIEALRIEASEAGDLMQVEQCDRAMRGHRKARAQCASVIAHALAQQDRRRENDAR